MFHLLVASFFFFFVYVCASFHVVCQEVSGQGVEEDLDAAEEEKKTMNEYVM